MSSPSTSGHGARLPRNPLSLSVSPLPEIVAEPQRQEADEKEDDADNLPLRALSRDFSYEDGTDKAERQSENEGGQVLSAHSAV